MNEIQITFETDDFEITESLVTEDCFKISSITPEIWRGLDEHIKVYEQLIKDLKSLQSNK